MATRVDPNFMHDLEKFGVKNWKDCFHCGNCTAICQLTEKDILFPRKTIRQAQMGLKDKLASNGDPWLCYYCGECSETCPRDANPGEIMMALRRYLTSIYDWTGFSGFLYKSFTAHLFVMLFLFFAVIISFLLFGGLMLSELTPAGGVQLNTFAHPEMIATIDHILLLSLSLFLITNILNMYYKVIVKDKSVKIPIWIYISEIGEAVVHFATQLRFSKCNKSRMYWFGHWFLMIGYVTMFIFIIFFLTWFQTEDIHAWYHPQRLIGYIITAGFLFGTVYFMIGRVRKKKEIFKYSHHSDWIFVVLLFMVALTGILIHIFRVNGLPFATYYSYIIHLAFEVPMVVTFVAFSKWSHLAYRPLAIYFTNMKKKASALQLKSKLSVAV
ncbi:MAG: 4Fe-4S dicluster domain-containing protein [Prolixibacteraceae bacterium]|jgi:quinone-modifying oxidoreductase, subunit QmoC|nr:4Fe-4S dicluster domain-containing protein [Prolixibacteraceae bacterium]MBT6999651.1 4Fe-4S dicluster domain-containing protein [Prolixibacteraceae bacterium]MBT7394988.1 4Fe-4S dicluster domain-containing protein [Prolixibacteraceae bacterium]